MAELENGKTVSLEELMVSTLAMTDALAKLLIDKGVITDAEFKQKLLEERAAVSAHSKSDNAMITSLTLKHGDTLQCSNTKAIRSPAPPLRYTWEDASRAALFSNPPEPAQSSNSRDLRARYSRR
jgi:hypothetical protein